jgi:Glycosyl hydrolase family 99
VTASRLVRAIIGFIGLLSLGSAALSTCGGSGGGGGTSTTTTSTTASTTSTSTSTTSTSTTTSTTSTSTTTSSTSTSTTTTTSTTVPPVDVQPAFPIHAAFYYPWFPEAWTQQGIYPYSNYTPTLGFYDSSDTNLLANHVAAMQGAGLDAAIASWWGQGTATDGRIPALLAAANGTSFRWALYYEQEGTTDPSVAQIQSDLTYIEAHYGTATTFLRVNGRPVLFVYAGGTDGCAMADRWVQANADHAFYIVLKVFSGYRTCASQPDAWHQYGPAAATDSQTGYSFTISPGFWKAGETAPRLARDQSRWTTNVQQMIASRAPWQLVTTFNEWGEGTAVESSTTWNSAYLDILGQQLRGATTTTTTTSVP